MEEWAGLCICATIKGRVGEETFQGNCRINGSQTQLPARSITRAHIAARQILTIDKSGGDK